MSVIICVNKCIDNKRARILPAVFLLLFSTIEVCSQVPSWQVGLFSFFDNNESDTTALKIPQTIAGIQLSPEVVFSWDSVHVVKAGINLLHEFGSNAAIDIFCPTAYYELDKRPLRFIMGAFPRPEELSEYPRLFFQDSIEYYRPNINGIFWEYRRNNGYVDLWLDWTGRQSEKVRETFLAGLSGRYNYGIFYARYHGYMFHFAGFKNPAVEEAYHDNLVSLASVGVDFSGRTFFTRLEANAGWVSAAERARADKTGWILLSGILAEARVEYKFIGLFNSIYRGAGLMYFYDSHDNDLYWGDPGYRAKTYNRSYLYLKFVNSKTVTIDLAYSLHFLESKIYHEQLLKVRVNLNNH